MKTQEQKTEKEVNVIINIQSELKVPKGNYNSFGKYKYRSAEDILEALKPLLKKYNVILKLSDTIKVIGNKIFLKSTAKIWFGEGHKSVAVSFGFAELSEHKGMSAEQATGTASSYARKYALNGLFLIDETESDADHDNKKEVARKPVLNADTEAFGKAVEYLMKGGSIDAIKQKYEVSQEVETKLIKSI
jgi:hypothetical protein